MEINENQKMCVKKNTMDLYIKQELNFIILFIIWQLLLLKPLQIMQDKGQVGLGTALACAKDQRFVLIENIILGGCAKNLPRGLIPDI